MKVILGLISLIVIAGCNSGGDAPGPNMPAVNSPEANKQTEEMLKKVPPEFAARARQLAEQGQKNSGPPPNAKR